MTDRDTQDILHEFDDLEPLEIDPIEEGDEPIVADLEPIAEDLEPLEDLPLPERVPAIEVERDTESEEFSEPSAVLEELEAGDGLTTDEMDALVEPAAEPAPAAPAAPVEPVEPATPAAAAPAVAAPVAAAASPGVNPEGPVVKPGGIKSSSAGGSRRERMEKEREARKARPKKHSWERWAGPGEKPKRDMEKAPLLLRKAAWWLIIGCLFPWGGVGAAWMWVVVEKLLIAAGLYTWHQAHLYRDGAKSAGFVQKLGAKSFKPLFAVVIVLILVGFAPIVSWGDHTAFAEKGFLILAGLTFTHIYDYEHGGRFNPMFPLMFLAPGLGGLFALVKIFGESESIAIQEILAGLGAALVAVAGWMAAYTMYVALKEAKAHGDRKKAEALEARKAARAARTKS